jgi:hypothetical protein
MWLPPEIVRKIMDMADLSIDTRRAFGLPPRRLGPWRIAHIDWLLTRHAGIFYFSETKSLHNFRVPDMHIVRRPIDVSQTDDDLTIFNLNQKEYSLEIYSNVFLLAPGIKSTWATELPVTYCVSDSP